jgi:predicted nuclease of predicted toxin-antitoxin system
LLMRILLDECLPKKLKKDFLNHEVKTVPEMGWAGKKNGELLPLAESHFDIFITVDQNLQYQQNLKGRFITIFVLKSPNSRYETLKLLIPNVLEKIKRELEKGVIEIENEPSA